MRSSPKRICGFIRPEAAATSPDDSSSRYPGDGGRPHVDRHPPGLVGVAGAHVEDGAAVVHHHRDRPVSGCYGWGEPGQDRHRELEADQVPVGGEGLGDQVEFGGLETEDHLGKLHVVEGYHRMDDHLGEVDRLAHHRPVDLALRRDVDDGVGQHHGLAAQAEALGDRATSPVAQLGGAGIRQDAGFGGRDLAAAAQAPPAAHRVEVHPAGAGRVEDGGPGSHRGAYPRRVEHHTVRVVHAFRRFGDARPAVSGRPCRGPGARRSTRRSPGRSRPGRRRPSPRSSPRGAWGS